MDDDLSLRLDALRSRSLAWRLERLEGDVRARINAAQTPEADSPGWRWRAGFVAGVLVVGLAAGGAAARSVNGDPSPFAIDHAYALSTLFEGGK